MTIPAEPLRLSFDPDELLLAELEMIEGRSGVSSRELREFLAKYGNWTQAQRDGLQRKDALAIWAEMRRQVYAALVPKANGGGS